MVLAPGGVATLITMPFVGVALKKFDGRRIIFTGLVVGSISLFMMSRFTLDASYWDFMMPRVLLGFGLAMVFVPLTTLTFSTISREQMGNATGFFNLLRNIGGSVGIGFATTMIARYSQFYQTVLVSNVNPYNPIFQQRAASMHQGLILRGVVKENAAMAALYAQVQRQAAMLAYNRIFFIMSISFVVVAPLLFLLNKGHGKGTPGAH
jgi:DHA2 family multidrug resistance protein